MSATFSPSVSLPFRLKIGVALYSAVLFHDAARALFKCLGILFGPPIVQVALGVELPSFIVESVRQLMSDHCPDRAVVHGIVSCCRRKEAAEYRRGN